MTTTPPGGRSSPLAVRARRRYHLDAVLRRSRTADLADIRTSRAVAAAINEGRARGAAGGPPVDAGELSAMGLLDEVQRIVVDRFRRGPRGKVLLDVEADLRRRDPELLDRTLRQYVVEFPPLALGSRRRSPAAGAPRVSQDAAAAWLDGTIDGVPGRQLALDGLLRLSLANENPALSGFRELIDDRRLAADGAYRPLVTALRAGLRGAPGLDLEEPPLDRILAEPALAEPGSVAAQLRHVRDHWRRLLGPEADDVAARIALVLDVLVEEQRAAELRFAAHAPFGPGAAAPIDYAGLGDEPERYTLDRDWMPELVLLARNAYVWLEQLSGRHGRRIARLDEIPDSELDTLASRGISGLWLIGVWERSRASRRIKRLRGSDDAEASAYSLFDYEIAADIGGSAALNDLRVRATARGIRLASDMVPNHMGIDSRWVMDRPEWFLAVDAPPYPTYSFSGPDLSDDPAVGIQIEDHFWDDSDAAVVFRRTDRSTGAAQFIYHGNDGTRMPWNDTAQLDFLQAEVREAVVRVVLEVARRFPIIRFDAAMVLAREHIQRLWWPEPGSGGAIPSRAEFAMSREEFDRRMPREFWRDVVDRVAAEAPETLLLAEAFWLMEGYFVRTLGMHRVYNSAFMHMLRDEDNAGYRVVLKNTLAFDPEVLRRFVNFMSNPDERTAIDQFGSGDRYFGVCTLLATLPGLPMIAHGQFEGFTEKYGMEFRRPRLDEQPDAGLIDHHVRMIVPLLRHRELFAGASEFRLYDCVDDDGAVLEDVYAFSNRSGTERALVIYHHREARISGWIRDSVPWAERDPEGHVATRSASLAEALAVPGTPGMVLAFSDARRPVVYLAPADEIGRRGLRVELGPYECRVILGWEERPDPDGSYARQAADLNGRAAPAGEPPPDRRGTAARGSAGTAGAEPGELTAAEPGEPTAAEAGGHAEPGDSRRPVVDRETVPPDPTPRTTQPRPRLGAAGGRPSRGDSGDDAP